MPLRVEVLVAQSYMTPRSQTVLSPSSSAHEILQLRMLGWVPISTPEDLPDPGIEPGCPSLQADSLPFEPQWKPKLTN